MIWTLSRSSPRRPAARAVALLLAAWSVCCGSLGRAEEASAPPADAAFFRQHVQPIFLARCQHCHGGEMRKADLDLSTPAGIAKGGESGPIVDRENPRDSTLYQYVQQRVMPPEGEQQLTDDEIARISRWIEAGAALGEAPLAAEETLTEHDVLPTLLLRCAICHGRQRREGGLDLRSVATALTGGKSGPAIVPGKPEESLLVQKIAAAEMPPRRTLAFYSVKPVTDAELDTIQRWIAAGVPRGNVQPDVATTEPDPLVSDEDRRFWAFQPPRTAPVPQVSASGRVRTPVDAFLLESLGAAGLAFAPEADRRTLIRRVYFDLIGLPPEPAEVEAFVSDSRFDAYEQLVERVLASPHYGERWAQHWLDVAGYSDSEGIQHADDVRPHAWRYRDYVVRSFNDDKPYDRFLLEQLAGDELADYEHAPEITPGLYDNLVATTFLRLVPDATYSPITGFVPDRLAVIDNEIEVLGSAVLGLTIKCARCHSHKFDPIPQRDYYRLAAALKGALDEHDWLATRTKGPDQPADAIPSLLPHVPAAEVAAWEAAGANPDTRPMVRAVWDRGEPSPTYILRRGNYLTPTTLVGPGVPSVLTDGRTPFEVHPPWPGSQKTGRRLALARWITRRDHPLTARVFVNRIWKYHFGEGIVTSLDNFGKMGTPPSHPELLDWLAVQFVDSGWSIKSLHRLMVNSSAYRQTSAVSPEQLQLDPDNVLVSRMPLRRMEGEVLRDSLLQVAGRLDPTPFGPAAALSARGDGLVTAETGNQRRWRRSIYVLKRRTQPLTILQNFDVAAMDPNCIERRESIVAPQALHLHNNATVHELALALAERVWQQAGDDPRKQIEIAFRLATSRPPTDAEREIALAGLGELEAEWARQNPGHRTELTATAHLWVRESAPDTVYENDLVSVWSSSQSADEGRRIGLVEFDVSSLAELELTGARLELAATNQTPLSQSTAIVPPGIVDLNWNAFVRDKLPLALPLAQLGRMQIASASDVNLGAYLPSAAATSDDLELLRTMARTTGKLTLVLTADESAAFRQDWDDGVHGSSRGKPPRLVVFDDRLDPLAARRRALDNLCHALFNSAAFLYID